MIGAVNSFAACGGDSLPISDSDQLPFTVGKLREQSEFI
jgi:hypothetical protein